jgi:hypothetical protein
MPQNTLQDIRVHAQTLRAISAWEDDPGRGVAEAVRAGYDSLRRLSPEELDLAFEVARQMDEDNCVVPDIRSWV